jgi:hypothetical protein
VLIFFSEGYTGKERKREEKFEGNISGIVYLLCLTSDGAFYGNELWQRYYVYI